MNDANRQSAAAPDSLPPGPEAIEQEIARLIAPGLEANAWRADFEAFRQRRLWDENHHARRIRILRRELRKLADQPVLDLGTGRGGLAVALRREGYRVAALDVRQRYCRVARLRALRYDLELPAVRASGERLPFADETFGVVICRDVLEHSEWPVRVLGEIWRVLRAGGCCYVTVINRWCWVDPHYHLFGISFIPRPLAERYIAQRGRSKESIGDRQRLSDLNYYHYAEFVRWAGGAGFEVRDVQAEQLRRYRHDGLTNRFRWFLYRALRPLSLQSNAFEFLLCKVGKARKPRWTARGGATSSPSRFGAT